MPVPPSLDSLPRELVRRGLPRGYVARVVRELADHADDLRDAAVGEDAAAERLGDPTALADQIVARYQGRTFAGRHPVLTFVVAPIPLVVLAYLGLVLAALLPIFACDALGVSAWDMNQKLCDWPLFEVWLLLSLHYSVAYGPFVLVTWLLCRLAQRSGRGPGWLAAACLFVALAATTFVTKLKLPDAPGTGCWMVGLPFEALLYPNAYARWCVIRHQIAQALVPLAIGAFVLGRAALRRRRALADLA